MSSALQTAQPAPTSRPWWPKVQSASKSSTISYRSSKSPTSATPSTSSNKLSKMPPLGAVSVSEQVRLSNHKPPQRITSKPSLKFNTLTSVFKSKKTNSPTIIPPGPVSPPLPFQNPPPTSPPRSRTKTVSSGSSSYSGGIGVRGPKSPVDSSIYTLPSSEEGMLEPLTPSDQLSARQRSSYKFHYQTSLRTSFSDQQDASRYLSTGDRTERERRISVMSDPSIIDPHLKRDYSIPHPSARASSSSYYTASSQNKSNAQSGTKNVLLVAETYERRKSSIDSRPSREFDLSSSYGSTSSTRPKSAGSRPRNEGSNARATNTHKPTLPHLTASGLSSSALRRSNSAVPSPSMTAVIALNSGLNLTSNSRSVSPASATLPDISRQGKTPTKFEDSSYSPSARLSPSLGAGLSSIRQKASSTSQGSTSGSSQAGAGVLRSPSLNSSSTLSRGLSIASGGTGIFDTGSNSSLQGIHRQPSSSRLRGTLPPSRTPPPTFDLPPTPVERPPSPLTFRSRRLSASSLLNSPISPESDVQSIMAFELPPMTPSSDDSMSSKGMSFAQPPSNGRTREKDQMDRKPFSSIRNGLREARNAPRSVTSPVMSPIRSKEEHQYRSSTQPLQSKAPLSSTQALVNALSGGGRGGETPTQRLVKKSASQSSISAFMGRERTRVDSAASTTSSTLLSEESSSLFGSVGKTIKKQRSLHATRGSGAGGLPIPPLPSTKQLRHASSFSATISSSDAALEESRSHGRFEGQASNVSSHKRPVTSSTPVSTPTSSVANSPATPQTQKKRSIFTRDRRDSNNQNERDRQDFTHLLHGNESSHSSDKRKAHSSQTSGLGINLGIFGSHFSSGSGSHGMDYSHERSPASARGVPLSPQQVSQSLERSPSPIPPPILDQHIVPPKELEMLLRMESIADVQEPSSPLQFSSVVGDDPEEEWSLDQSSVLDAGSVRSRMGSVSDVSSAYGRSDAASMKSTFSSPGLSTRRFASASGSITVRLQSERPSTASRLPTRNTSRLSRDLRDHRNNRPSTAQTSSMRSSIEHHSSPLRSPVSNGNDCPSDSDYAPIALPPPPRRKGLAVSSPSRSDESEASAPPPLRSQSSSRLQRLASHETITSYNPNRGSIFRKPSFLNIDDEFVDQVGTMSSVPEDSFLILEHGKDSLDLRRSLDSSDAVIF